MASTTFSLAQKLISSTVRPRLVATLTTTAKTDAAAAAMTKLALPTMTTKAPKNKNWPLSTLLSDLDDIEIDWPTQLEL